MYDDANTGRVRGCSVAMTQQATIYVAGQARPHAETAAMERIKLSPHSARVGCPDTVRMHPLVCLPSHGLTVCVLGCRYAYDDESGVRTTPLRTAALTQHLRPLGHPIAWPPLSIVFVVLFRHVSFARIQKRCAPCLPTPASRIALVPSPTSPQSVSTALP